MSQVDRETVCVPCRSTIIIDRSPNRVRGPRPSTSSRPPTCSSTPRSFRSRFRRGPLLAKFFTSRPQFFFWGENKGPGSVEHSRYANARASSTFFRSNKQRSRRIAGHRSQTTELYAERTHVDRQEIIFNQTTRSVRFPRNRYKTINKPFVNDRRPKLSLRVIFKKNCLFDFRQHLTFVYLDTKIHRPGPPSAETDIENLVIFRTRKCDKNRTRSNWQKKKHTFERNGIL